MKFLILSVTAGQGHHSCAKAICDMMHSLCHQCEIIDTYKYMNPMLGETIDKGYLLSTKYLPDVYGSLYNYADKAETGSGVTHVAHTPFSKKLRKHIERLSPDAIICTHVFPAIFVSREQEKGHLLGIKTIGIVTDFTLHPYWQMTKLSAYVTANELLTFQCEKKQIKKENIYPLGIPIKTEFSTHIEKTQARGDLGIENKDTVLIMSGSMGYGNITQIVQSVDSIDMDFQMLVVCGNNKKGKAALEKMRLSHSAKIFGFIDNVHVLMDASDFIITKPGGLSVSECMAKRLPMILAEPIPGQEQRNLEFLLNNGIAYSVSDTYPVEEAVYQFLHSDWRRENFERTMIHMGKPNATRDVCELAISLSAKC